MILIILSSFILLSLAMLALLSYEFRLRIQDFFLDLISQSKQQFSQAKQFVQKFHQAASPEHLQSEWYLQQWWILIAGFFLFSSIILFAFTRPISATKIEADYLREVDPQVYALL